MWYSNAERKFASSANSRLRASRPARGWYVAGPLFPDLQKVGRVAALSFKFGVKVFQSKLADRFVHLPPKLLGVLRDSQNRGLSERAEHLTRRRSGDVGIEIQYRVRSRKRDPTAKHRQLCPGTLRPWFEQRPRFVNRCVEGCMAWLHVGPRKGQL